MQLDRLDHLVLTVQEIEKTCEFYSRVLGMRVITFGENRKAVQFGQQKLNLHQAGQDVEPKAAYPTPGSADLCFITETPLEQVVAELRSHQVNLETDIVQRTGAVGTIASIYLRDPDGNLLEISHYLTSPSQSRWQQ
jgi:catechol 2,3-dioxygenase-like lactoylglutathione lyase family enzyme